MQRLTLDNLDNLTGLAGLAQRSGVDIKPTLLRVLTDLYIQKMPHTPQEEQHFTELALRLIEVVDQATCAAVAARLRTHPDAPALVLERLERMEARPQRQTPQGSVELFTESSLDDDLGLFEPPAPAAPAPAVEHTAPQVQPAPAPAADIRAIDYIAQREAFFTASSEERRLILASLEPVADQDVPLAQETNIIRYLEQAALAGRAQEFTTLLQQGLGISRALARRIVTDSEGEPFVVSARALVMPTDVFQRILMSLNPAIGHSVNRVFDLSDLYLQLPEPSAHHLVSIWRAADRIEARSVLHRRVHWDETPADMRRSAPGEERRTETIASQARLRRESAQR